MSLEIAGTEESFITRDFLQGTEEFKNQRYDDAETTFRCLDRRLTETHPLKLRLITKLFEMLSLGYTTTAFFPHVIKQKFGVIFDLTRDNPDYEEFYELTKKVREFVIHKYIEFNEQVAHYRGELKKIGYEEVVLEINIPEISSLSSIDEIYESLLESNPSSEETLESKLQREIKAEKFFLYNMIYTPKFSEEMPEYNGVHNWHPNKEIEILENKMLREEGFEFENAEKIERLYSEIIEYCEDLKSRLDLTSEEFFALMFFGNVTNRKNTVLPCLEKTIDYYIERKKTLINQALENMGG